MNSVSTIEVLTFFCHFYLQYEEQIKFLTALEGSILYVAVVKRGRAGFLNRVFKVRLNRMRAVR